jgi:septation ring formation regulator EzrA
MADAPISKARLAAQMVAERKRKMDERAQALIDRMPGFDSRMNQAFEAHEGSLDSGEADFDAMLEEVKDLERSNSKNGEGSGDTSGTSFRKE